jgi:hypothetical protein
MAAINWNAMIESAIAIINKNPDGIQLAKLADAIALPRTSINRLSRELKSCDRIQCCFLPGLVTAFFPLGISDIEDKARAFVSPRYNHTKLHPTKVRQAQIDEARGRIQRSLKDFRRGAG